MGRFFDAALASLLVEERRVEFEVDAAGLAAMKLRRKREPTLLAVADAGARVKEKTVEITGALSVELKLEHIGALAAAAESHFLAIHVGSKPIRILGTHAQVHARSFAFKRLSTTLGGGEGVLTKKGGRSLENIPLPVEALHMPPATEPTAEAILGAEELPLACGAW